MAVHAAFSLGSIEGVMALRAVPLRSLLTEAHVAGLLRSGPWMSHALGPLVPAMVTGLWPALILTLRAKTLGAGLRRSIGRAAMIHVVLALRSTLALRTIPLRLRAETAQITKWLRSWSPAVHVARALRTAAMTELGTAFSLTGVKAHAAGPLRSRAAMAHHASFTLTTAAILQAVPLGTLLTEGQIAGLLRAWTTMIHATGSHGAALTLRSWTTLRIHQSMVSLRSATILRTAPLGAFRTEAQVARLLRSVLGTTMVHALGAMRTS